jgi:NitT/TauT family transport system ATP-binding protein
VQEVLEVELPRRRDQVETKELPEFAHLRAHVYRAIKGGQAAGADSEGVAVDAGAATGTDARRQDEAKLAG